jgi:hypothetical protein
VGSGWASCRGSFADGRGRRLGDTRHVGTGWASCRGSFADGRGRRRHRGFTLGHTTLNCLDPGSWRIDEGNQDNNRTARKLDHVGQIALRRFEGTQWILVTWDGLTASAQQACVTGPVNGRETGSIAGATVLSCGVLVAEPTTGRIMHIQQGLGQPPTIGGDGWPPQDATNCLQSSEGTKPSGRLLEACGPGQRMNMILSYTASGEPARRSARSWFCNRECTWDPVTDID